LLAAQADVDVWVGPDQPVLTRVDPQRVIDYGQRPARLGELRSYDAVIYHLGNNAMCHAADYEVFCDFPGVVVLHDFVLHHFFLGYHAQLQQRPDRYVAAMEYSHGPGGRTMAERILADQRLLGEVGVHRYPLNRHVLDLATGVIVHSNFTQALVRATHPALPTKKIQHYAKPLPSPENVGRLRARYGLPAGAVILGAFGEFAPAKRIDVALRAIARLERRNILLLLVGTLWPGLNDLVDSLGLGQVVRCIEWVDLDVLNDYLRLTDIVVNLRCPSMGETSGAATRALAAGKACVVTDDGWFSELPDDCVVKTTLGDGEEDMVVESLRRLVDDEALRRRLGENAAQHMRAHHNPNRVAREYIEFLQRPEVGNDPLGNTVVDTVAAEMTALGVHENDQSVLDDVAESLAALLARATRS
jgi:glycosyltransferase involved in cell wall biosynthesis